CGRNDSTAASRQSLAVRSIPLISFPGAVWCAPQTRATLTRRGAFGRRQTKSTRSSQQRAITAFFTFDRRPGGQVALALRFSALFMIGTFRKHSKALWIIIIAVIIIVFVYWGSPTSRTGDITPARDGSHGVMNGESITDALFQDTLR